MPSATELAQRRYIEKIRAVQMSSYLQYDESGESYPINEQMHIADEKAYYPTKGLSSACINAYSRQPQSLIPDLKVSDDYFLNYGTIEKNGAYTRKQICATMVKYIEDCGGISKASAMYSQINTSIWNVCFDDEDRRDGAMYLRKDFLTYINELAKRACNKLQKQKLTINSAYRSVGLDYKIQVNLSNSRGDDIALWNGHNAGMAIDISATGEDRVIIADIAYELGFGGIAIGTTFVHIDTLGDAKWKYPGVPKYIKPGSPSHDSYK